jgi:hypothetical protein
VILKVACYLAVILFFSSCSSTKVDATYTKSDKETKSAKIENVISLFKVPVTICYVLSDAEIPFKVDLPFSMCERIMTLSYEVKYAEFKEQKIQTHMVSLQIPF